MFFAPFRLRRPNRLRSRNVFLRNVRGARVFRFGAFFFRRLDVVPAPDRPPVARREHRAPAARDGGLPHGFRAVLVRERRDERRRGGRAAAPAAAAAADVPRRRVRVPHEDVPDAVAARHAPRADVHREAQEPYVRVFRRELAHHSERAPHLALLGAAAVKRPHLRFLLDALAQDQVAEPTHAVHVVVVHLQRGEQRVLDVFRGERCRGVQSSVR